MQKKIALLLVLFLLVLVISCSDYTTSKICGTHSETYTSNAKGCDKMSGCSCLHKEALGFGSCDSCECTKEVSNC